MLIKRRVLLNPAGESSGNVATTPAVTPLEITPAAPAAKELPQGQTVTVPVTQDGKVVIPGEADRGNDQVIGKPEDTLNIAEFDTDLAPEKPAASTPEPPKPTAPAEPKVPAATITEPVKPAVTAPTVVPPTEPVKPAYEPHPDHAKQARDYTGFEEADAQALRAAPNNVFNHFKTRLPALKKDLTEAQTRYNELLKANGVPASFHEHPESYRLTKQYKDKEQLFGQLESEEMFWSRQLEAINSGAKVIKELKGYDANGNPIMSDIVINDDNAAKMQASVTRLLGVLSEKKGTVAREAQTLEAGFKARHGNLVQIIRDGEDKYFPFYKEGDPGFTPELKKSIDDVINMLPPEVQGSLLARPLAKAFTLIRQLNYALNELKKTSPAVATTNVHGKPTQQPVNGDAGVINADQGGGKGNDEILRMSDFGVEPA